MKPSWVTKTNPEHHPVRFLASIWQQQMKANFGLAERPMTDKEFGQLKALLALIGTTLITALLLWTFVVTFLNVLRDLVPAVSLFSSFIYAFGCFSVAVFLYIFHRAQS